MARLLELCTTGFFRFVSFVTFSKSVSIPFWSWGKVLLSMLELVNYRAKLGVFRCLRHLVFRLSTRSPRHMIRVKEK